MFDAKIITDSGGDADVFSKIGKTFPHGSAGHGGNLVFLAPDALNRQAAHRSAPACKHWHTDCYDGRRLAALGAQMVGESAPETKG
jgi:hypothetical protein